jgi:hypothetical protein
MRSSDCGVEAGARAAYDAKRLAQFLRHVIIIFKSHFVG